MHSPKLSGIRYLVSGIWYNFFSDSPKNIMSIKKNEATRQRPAGDRFLDSPALVVNLPSWLDQLMREESWKDSDRNAVTVAKSDRITVTLIALHEGAMMGNKELERFFMAEVLAGNVQLELQGGEVRLEKGDLIVLHPEVDHLIQANSNACILLTSMATEAQEGLEGEALFP